MKVSTKKKSSMVRPIIVVAAVVLLILVPFYTSSNIVRIMLNMAMYCTLGQMWNLMSGYAGMTSLGQQIFVGLAGYSVAVTTTTFGLPFWLGMALGAVISIIVSIGLSAILFRMSGMYFAIATWVTAEALRILFKGWDFVKKGAGMTLKISPYPSPNEIYWMAIVLTIIAMIVVYIVLNSRIGLGLTAMRDDESAAASVGVNTFNTKLFCFILCAGFTALAGSLFYINKGSIFPDDGFGNSWTIAAVFIVIIGGVGTMVGPIVGTVIYVFLTDFLSRWPGWSMIILGIIAIAVILFLPYGIVGTIERKLNFEFLSSRRHAHDLYEAAPSTAT